MARTWREIPNSPYRDCNFLQGAPLEEKKHPDYTKRVRDKDNTQAPLRPKDWRKMHQRRFRAREREQLRKIEQAYWKNPTKYIGDDPYSLFGMEVVTVLPLPKEFRPYYW